jgi:hypothetical protein
MADRGCMPALPAHANRSCMHAALPHASMLSENKKYFSFWGGQSPPAEGVHKSGPSQRPAPRAPRECPQSDRFGPGINSPPQGGQQQPPDPETGPASRTKMKFLSP